MGEYNWSCKRCNTMITMGTKDALKKARKEHRCSMDYLVKHEPRPFMVRTAQSGRVLIDPITGQAMIPKSKKQNKLATGADSPSIPMEEIKKLIEADQGSPNPLIIEGETMEAKSLDLVKP